MMFIFQRVQCCNKQVLKLHLELTCCFVMSFKFFRTCFEAHILCNSSYLSFLQVFQLSLQDFFFFQCKKQQSFSAFTRQQERREASRPKQEVRNPTHAYSRTSKSSQKMELNYKFIWCKKCLKSMYTMDFILCIFYELLKTSCIIVITSVGRCFSPLSNI